MDFTIYSIGSAPFLHQIIMAVTSIINAGSYSTLVAVGLLIGILTAAFQGMASGGRDIPIFPVAVGALLFALMFGPKVDLAIEDVYSAEVRSVSDVPIGIAAPGSFISQIGYRLARTFETAFQPVGVTSPPLLTSEEGGGAAFADALKLLNNVRRSATAPSVLEAFDQLEGGSFRQSWDNYIRECVAIKVDRGETTMEQIYAAADHVEALRFDNPLFGTEIIHGGARQQLSCSEAYEVLNDWTDSGVESDEVWGALARLSGRHHTQGYDNLLGADPAAALDQQITNMTSSMHSLVEAGEGAQQYVRTALLEPIFQESMAGRYTDLRDFSTAAMINSALQQRNIQWASEQTIFMSIVRPMITFIEGFSYAIMPFLGFILVMGAAGMKLAVKYGQMLLWIQLWLPVLAITNFFLYMVASHDLANTPGHTTSFYALHHAADRMGHWISVGGMLAAATPVLTLVLLTGSTYAMTSMAQRMQGADHVNEKQLSPDVMQQGPLLNNMADTTNAPGQAAMRTGWSNHMPSLNIGEMSQDTYQSARRELTQAQEQFSTQFGQAWQESAQSGLQSQMATNFGRQLQSSGTQQVQSLDSLASMIQSQHSGLNMTREELTGRIGAALALGRGLSLGGGSESSSSTGTTISASELQSMANQVQLSGSDTASLTRTLASGIQATDGSFEQYGVTDTTSSSLTDSASRLESVGESYDETSSLTRNIGFSQSVGMADAAHAIHGDGAARGQLQDYFNYSPNGRALREDAMALADRYHDQGKYGIADRGVAETAAMIDILRNSNSFGGDAEAHREGVGAIVGAYGTAIGTDIPTPQGDPTAYRGQANPRDTSETRGLGNLGGSGTRPGSYVTALGGPDPEAAVAADYSRQVRAAQGAHDERNSAQASQLMRDAIEQATASEAPDRPAISRLLSDGSRVSGSTNFDDGILSWSPQGDELQTLGHVALDAAVSGFGSRVDDAVSRALQGGGIDAITSRLPGVTPENAQFMLEGAQAEREGRPLPSSDNPYNNAYAEIGASTMSPRQRDFAPAMDAIYAGEALSYGQEVLNLSPGQATVYAASRVGSEDLAADMYNEGRLMIRDEARQVSSSTGEAPDERRLNYYANKEAERLATVARQGPGAIGLADEHSRTYNQFSQNQ